MARKKNAAGEAPPPLNQAQVFFLANHVDLGDESAAAMSGATAEQVAAFRGANPTANKLNRMLHKPSEGVVAMTGEASTLAEEVARRGAVTQDMINRAAAAEDFALARELKDLMAGQKRDERVEARARNADRWHVMER